MAADPVAAATALAGQTYAGAQERTAATQKALLDSMAANGTYQNSLNTAATSAAAPTAAPAGPAYNPAYPQIGAIADQGAQQVSTMGQAALAAATALAAHQAQTAQQANSNYFAQAAAAMPLEQSRAASSGAQVLGDLQAKRDAIAAAKAQAAIQLQISQNELAKSRLSSSSPYGGKAPFSSPNEALAFKTSAQAQAGGSAFSGLLRTVTDANGKTTTVKTPAYEAASYLASTPGATMQDALKHVPGVYNGDEQAIADAVNQYNSNLDQVNYFGLLGYQRPAVVHPTQAGLFAMKTNGYSNVW